MSNGRRVPVHDAATEAETEHRIEIVTLGNSCTVCCRSFSTKGNLLRHQKLKSCDKNTSKLIIHCAIVGCIFHAWEKKIMIIHYEVSHDIKLEKEMLQFNNPIEFEKWKECYESTTRGQFVKSTSTKQDENKLFTYYVCHRDGYFHSRGKGSRNLKLLGTNKINAHCPARIDVHTSKHDGKLTVYLTKTHVGHTLDIDRLILSESDKKAIAQKISLKIPFEEIINDIQDSAVDDQLKRIHLITKKDLWNIAESFNLKHMCHQNDYLKQKSSSVGRLYKSQQTTLENLPQLDNFKQKSNKFIERKDDVLKRIIELSNKISTEEQLSAFEKNTDALEMTLLGLEQNIDVFYSVHI